MDEHKNKERWKGMIPSDTDDEKREFLTLCIDIVWKAYREAGYPFGRSRTGFILWSQHPASSRLN